MLTVPRQDTGTSSKESKHAFSTNANGAKKESRHQNCLLAKKRSTKHMPRSGPEANMSLQLGNRVFGGLGTGGLSG